MLEEVIVSYCGVEHRLFVVGDEAFYAQEMFALLVVGPQFLHRLNLNEISHFFDRELTYKGFIYNL